MRRRYGCVLLWLRHTLFGFRKGELLNLKVRQVDLLDHTIRLNAGETKSGEGRVVKLTKNVFVLLQACVSGKGAADYVFTRDDGQPVRDFGKHGRRCALRRTNRDCCSTIFAAVPCAIWYGVAYLNEWR